MGAPVAAGSGVVPSDPPGAVRVALSPPQLGVESDTAAVYPLPPLGPALAALSVTLGARLDTVGRVDVTGTFYRGVRAAYLARTPPTPLYYAASLRGARYTPPVWGPAGLYLAGDQATVLAELRDLAIGAGGRVRGGGARDPVTLFSVDVAVDSVLDLTDRATRRHLRLTLDAIRTEWQERQRAWLLRADPPPMTQLLGALAHRAGVFGGILFPSARYRYGVNLLVFPDRLAGGAHVTVQDTTGRFVQRLP